VSQRSGGRKRVVRFETHNSKLWSLCVTLFKFRSQLIFHLFVCRHLPCLVSPSINPFSPTPSLPHLFLTHSPISLLHLFTPSLTPLSHILFVPYFSMSTPLSLLLLLSFDYFFRVQSTVRNSKN
jgi:hypothetical protein